MINRHTALNLAVIAAGITVAAIGITLALTLK